MRFLPWPWYPHLCPEYGCTASALNLGSSHHAKICCQRGAGPSSTLTWCGWGCGFGIMESGCRVCLVASDFMSSPCCMNLHWQDKGFQSVLSPGLILIRVNPSRVSACPTGWWEQLLWPTRVRVCNHPWAWEHTRLRAWLHPGPYLGEFLFRAYNICLIRTFYIIVYILHSVELFPWLNISCFLDCNTSEQICESRIRVKLSHKAIFFFQ